MNSPEFRTGAHVVIDSPRDFVWHERECEVVSVRAVGRSWRYEVCDLQATGTAREVTGDFSENELEGIP